MNSVMTHLFRRLALPCTALALLTSCTEYEFNEFENTDIMQQNPWQNVDVLLVVDNSCSMQPYQDKLARDFGVFFDYFEGSEVVWQLAVVTTAADEPTFGRIRGPIVDADHDDPDSLFADVVNVGTNGWGIEAGLEAGLRAVSGINPNFPRDDATLSVIFVSDEEDASPGSVSDYIDGFYDVHGHRNRDAFNASALTVITPASCTPEQLQYSTKGTRYNAVAERTGGVVANLCEEDFGPIISELTLTTSAMRDTFYLSDRPKTETLTLGVGTEMLSCADGSWSYELVGDEGELRPAIVFSQLHIPPPDARIVAHYIRGNGLPSGVCPEGDGWVPDDGGLE